MDVYSQFKGTISVFCVAPNSDVMFSAVWSLDGIHGTKDVEEGLESTVRLAEVCRMKVVKATGRKAPSQT